jgi:hypothetical protein
MRASSPLILALVPALLTLGFLRAAEPAAPVGDGEALARGLESIAPERMRADLEFIASDALEGRDTPSAGQRIAARFLRTRLERLGLSPGARGGWFHEYPLGWRQIDLEQSFLQVGGARLVFGEDYCVGRGSDLNDAAASGPIVSIGGGRTAEVEGAELAGAWALVLEPGGSLRKLAGRLADLGAAGLLVAPGDGPNPIEKFARTTSALVKGQLSSVGKAQGLPVVYLGPSGTATLFAQAGLADVPPAGRALGIGAQELRRLTHPGGFRLFENVCALWPGSDPVLSKEVIILSAHYDHVGYNGGTRIHNGADDNGSGTTGLLALAEALTRYGPMRRTILLTWVSGEEKGLLGSAAWTRRPWLPEGHFPVANINIDMIGRNALDDLMITPTKDGRVSHEYNGLVRLAEANREAEGFKPFRSADEYWQRSDHMNYAKNLGLPVTFLFADVHEDYHGPGDDPEKINYEKMRRVVRLVLRMLDGLQGDVLELHDRPIPTAAEFLAQQRGGMVQDDLERLRQAARLVERASGDWPRDLAAVLASDGARAMDIATDLRDPWGGAYRLDGERFVCLGSDGAEGGVGAAADVLVE